MCEDYDLWLRLTCKHKAGLIEQAVTIKYGGHEDQLSMKHWRMDRFRVVALEKLLALHVRENEVKKELVKKYTLLLLKGAKKHQKLEDIKEYEKCLNSLAPEY